MLDVKAAAEKASEYFGTLFSKELAANSRLEEVELSEDGKYWLITLSYPASALQAIFGSDARREYKQFKIDIASGSVVSMKTFARFGLTDCGIEELTRNNYLVLTDDLRLSVQLQATGIDALNFNHLRVLNW